MPVSFRPRVAPCQPSRRRRCSGRGRWWLSVCGGVALLVVEPTVALAASTGEGSSVNCQAQVVRTNPVSMSSSYFVTIPGLSVGLSPSGPLTITVSGTVTGQPAAFEVVDTWSLMDAAVGRIMSPGPAIFTPPGKGVSSFSFTWVDSGKPAKAAHVLRVLWRRESRAGASTLALADVVATFDAGSC